MKNLKKVLALVLAFACAFTMFAGAAYSDQADIQHTDAVNMLSSLGVLDGYEDGSFRPEATITRAEMAKMIYTIRNGGNDNADAYKSLSTSFTDINGTWAEGYIKYCQVNGIIDGKSTTSFDPNGDVTVVETAKMALVLMGYKADANRANLVGTGWDQRTLALAGDNGLMENVSGGVASPITRDEAAQLLYNTVDAECVIWSNDHESFIKDELTVGGVASTRTVGTKYLSLEEAIGSFVGNKDTGATGKDGVIRIDVTYATDGSADGCNATADVSLDWIGEEIKILYKDAKDGTKDKLDDKDTVYGVYKTGDTEVLNVTSDDIKSAADFKTAGKIKVADTEYDVVTPEKGDVLVVTNYDNAKATKADAATAADAKAKFSALSGQNGNTVKFILNDDGEVEKAYVQTYALGTVTAVNSEKVTISGLGSIKIADSEIYEGIAKDDVVVYSQLYKSTLADATVVVTKAEVVSGEVTGYKGTENVTIDGTVYKIMDKDASLPTSVGGETGTAAFGQNDIGESFDLYLVKGYVAAAVQTSDSASNYSLVIADNDQPAGDKWDPLKIVVLAADGAETTLTVDEDSDSTSFNVGDIVTWTGSADAAMVTTKAAWATNADATNNYVKVTKGNEIYDSTSKTFNGTVTSSDCVLFVTTDGDTTAANLNESRTFKAYNIRDLKDIDAVSGDTHTIAVVDDDKVVAAFALRGAAPSGATSGVVYGIVTADNGTVKIEDDYYTQYIIASNSDTYTVNVKSGALIKGSIYGFAPSSDNLYDKADELKELSATDKYADESKNIDGTAYSVSTVAVKEYNENDGLLSYYTATAGSDGEFTGSGSIYTKAVADDVAIVYVDVDGNATGDEIGINPFDGVTGYLNAIIVVDDDEIVAVIVETSNEANVYE